jgi:hypothetical protein
MIFYFYTLFQRETVMVSLVCFEQSYSRHYKHCSTTAGQIITDRQRRWQARERGT